jgi:hypothetical protein
MIATLTHERVQHPVGQGFFHSAKLGVGGTHFEYLYDCGSVRREPLSEEIRVYADRSLDGIDVVFVSHLDNDHVSGLDNLLLLVRADTVVVPYLTTYERVLLAAKALDAGDVDGDCLQMLGDPVQWFSGRNVRRLIFITGDGHNILPALPDVEPILPPGDHETSHFVADNHRESRDRLALDETALETGATFRTTIDNRCDVLVLPDTVPLSLVRGTETVNWCFLSFVHPEEELQQTFRNRVREVMGASLPEDAVDKRGLPPDITAWLLSILQDRLQRNRLADLYRLGFQDRNLTSLSLYSGPIKPNKGRYELKEVRRPVNKAGAILETEPGWLGTGDADLRDANRRNAFLAHYDALIPYVATIALPHHGSRYNFHEAILPANVSLCVVGVDSRKRYGHPHPEVEAALRDRKLPLRQTTDAGNTRLVEAFELIPNGATISSAQISDQLQLISYLRAAFALLEPKYAHLLAQCLDKNWLARENALKMVSTAGSPAGLILGLVLHYDNDQDVRACAAALLGKLNDPGWVFVLHPGLKDASVFVRHETAKSLGTLRNNQAVAPLLEAIELESGVNDSGPGALYAMVEALGSCGDATIISVLDKYTDHAGTPASVSSAEAGQPMLNVGDVAQRGIERFSQKALVIDGGAH